MNNRLHAKIVFYDASWDVVDAVLARYITTQRSEWDDNEFIELNTLDGNTHSVYNGGKYFLELEAPQVSFHTKESQVDYELGLERTVSIPVTRYVKIDNPGKQLIKETDPGCGEWTCCPDIEYISYNGEKYSEDDLVERDGATYLRRVL